MNRSILRIGWSKLETYTLYKARQRACLFVKIAPHYSSQECAECSYISPANRRSQSLFVCGSCGYRENADRNAARVLKKRTIELILNSGTELSDKNVLFLPDIGRGDQSKTSCRRTRSKVDEASKKKEASSRGSLEALPLQGQPMNASA